MIKGLYLLYLTALFVGCVSLFFNFVSLGFYTILIWVFLGNIPTSLLFYRKVNAFLTLLTQAYPEQVKEHKLPISTRRNKPYMFSLELFSYYDIISKFSEECQRKLNEIRSFNNVLMLSFLGILFLGGIIFIINVLILENP
ncbi:hypothetical protein SAMN05216474_0374 [Lishizhenia tianjinensis]|uniref:Lipoprotein n=1 Tax=Lishizhenia tianjinensis TaxID=477690 RepID=A0A1I6XQS7_9FLAO|nr:hypothetical protein [Lishizhenia tianjinensis]SFT40433.1 hypothetical protein SAMN05216474_0374 [Lishizhenia tianjinensis]